MYPSLSLSLSLAPRSLPPSYLRVYVVATQFECPLPKLSPATFPPAMREPPPPALDQFDLDEHFAKEGLRLAQVGRRPHLSRYLCLL